EIINLNKARKDRARGDAKATAAKNHAAFGRSKGQKDAARIEAERLKRDLDGAKRGDEWAADTRGGVTSRMWPASTRARPAKAARPKVAASNRNDTSMATGGVRAEM